MLRVLIVTLALVALVAAEAWTTPNDQSPRVSLRAPAWMYRKRQTAPKYLTVEYAGSTPSQGVQDAVETSFNLLENTWVFNVTVTVRFAFSKLGWNATGPNKLGSCAPGQFLPCPPQASTKLMYPSALYKHLANASPYSFVSGCSRSEAGTNQDVWDIWAEFNEDAPFSFSGDPSPMQYDFVYVFMHEMIHGLGFSGAVAQSGSTIGYFMTQGGSNARAVAIYDSLVYYGMNGNTNPASQYRDSSIDTAWQSAVASTSLVIKTSSSDAASSVLFDPNTFVPGSSWYHLSSIYGGTPNQLMTPSLSAGSTIHTAGVITIRILEQMGWGVQPGAIAAAQTSSSITSSSTTATGSASVAAPLVVLLSVAILALVSLI